MNGPSRNGITDHRDFGMADTDCSTPAYPEGVQEPALGSRVVAPIASMKIEEAIVSTEVESNPQREIQGIRWFLVCTAVFSSNLLYGLDSTIVATIQTAIIQTYGDVAELGWLGIGFTLGSIAMILPIGKAYGIFNTKWLFISCLTMFAAGSALCGAAPNMNAMIVGRVWAGAGGAGMYLGNLNLISSLTTPQESSFFLGLTGLVYGTGCILGPIVGGSLADSSATWRWAFFLNLVLFGLMTPVYVFMLPSPQPQPNVPVFQKFKALDWLGTTLNAAIYITFAMLFTFGGTAWDWDDGRMIALYVIFGLCIISFVLTQYFSFLTAKERRLFPVEFLRSKTLVMLYIITASGGAALFVAIYYIPLYFQFVHGDSGTQAAVRLLPFISFYTFSVLVNGALMPILPYYMPWFLVSGIFMMIGGALMYTVKASTPASNIYGYTILLGLGMATTQLGFSVGPAKVPLNKASDAIQYINAAQGGSLLIALAIASTVFQNITFQGLSKVLGGSEYNTADIQAAIAGTKSVILESAPPEIRTAAVDIIVKSIDYAYVLVIVVGALTLICSCFLERERLMRKMSPIQ